MPSLPKKACTRSIRVERNDRRAPRQPRRVLECTRTHALALIDRFHGIASRHPLNSSASSSTLARAIE
jgi:hypothetical protein